MPSLAPVPCEPLSQATPQADALSHILSACCVNGLDEPLPRKQIGPKLERLGLGTYRDLLSLDVASLLGTPNLGRTTLTQLQALRDEALRRLSLTGQYPSRLSPFHTTEWSPDAIPQHLLETLSQSTEHPLLALGWLPLELAQHWMNLGLDSLSKLAQALAKSKQTALPKHHVNNVLALLRRYVEQGPFLAPHHDSRWQLSPHRHLGTLSARTTNALDRHAPHIQQLSDFVLWIQTHDLLSLPNVGRKTAREMTEVIERLFHQGMEALYFSGPPPKTLPDFCELWLQRLEDERAREVMQLRYQFDHTLKEVGERYDVTRERIRQIETKCLKRGPQWKEHGLTLLAPLLSAFESLGPVLLSTELTHYVGEHEPWHLRLLIDLCELEWCSVGPVLTPLPREDFLTFERSLRKDIAELIEFTPTPADVFAIFEEYGLAGSLSRLGQLLTQWLPFTLGDEGVFPAGQRTANRLRALLYAYPEGATLAQLLEDLRQEGPEHFQDYALRNVSALFQRSSWALHYQRNTWIHFDHLTISLEQRQALASWCHQELQASPELSLNCADLLAHYPDRTIAARLEAITLRDMLLRDLPVRGWISSLNVALKQRHATRPTTIAQHLLAEAELLDQPVPAHLLIKRVAAHGYSQGSVTAALIQSEDLLGLGLGRYVAWRCFLSPSECESALEAIYTALPAQGLSAVSMLQLPYLSPGLTELLEHLGSDALWALAKLSPQLQRRQRGKLLWRTEAGSTLWEACHLAQHLGTRVWRTRDLKELFSRLFHCSPDVAFSLQQSALQEGVLVRVNTTDYISAGMKGGAGTEAR